MEHTNIALALWPTCLFLPYCHLIRAKRVSNCYIPPQKNVCVCARLCVCVRLILLLVGSVKRYCYRYVCTTLYDTRYVLCTRYQIRMIPGISRQKSIRTYVMFRPWTHTSDDSYIYQLSLVVVTATVSLFLVAE